LTAFKPIHPNIFRHGAITIEHRAAAVDITTVETITIPGNVERHSIGEDAPVVVGEPDVNALNVVSSSVDFHTDFRTEDDRVEDVMIIAVDLYVDFIPFMQGTEKRETKRERVHVCVCEIVRP
tara:strand:- start:806 stop:1174 length:369 start_codon:yes stop_codon:yes gene_type:complete